MKKRNHHSLDIGKGLALLTQLAISIIVPMLLFVFGARYLAQKFAIGEWIIPAAIVLGLAVGMMSAWNMIQDMIKQQEKQMAKKTKGSHETTLKEAKERLSPGDKKFTENIQNSDKNEESEEED